MIVVAAATSRSRPFLRGVARLGPGGYRQVIIPTKINCHPAIGTITTSSSTTRYLATKPSKDGAGNPGGGAGDDDHWSEDKVSGYFGHNFPDFIEHWNRDNFRRVGYVLGGSTGVLAATLATSPSLSTLLVAPTVILGALTTAYWRIGLNDMKQTSHAIRRNYPVLGNMRYIFETIRPEIRQYLVEDDLEGRPFDRMRRSLVYQRAKNVDDTVAFGTRRDVYAAHYEWACHSMFPKPPVPPEDWQTELSEHPRRRTWIGTAEFGTTKPYSASILNISAMSYGAISDNAILSLSGGAKMGHFYHNTGEGGVSNSHKKGGGDLVWNIGTGYFGCGTTASDGSGRRMFDPTLFQETIQENAPQIKMIEVKLSQGAKPGHGGILPRAKITPEIAEARKLEYPATSDCHSPPSHSAFSNPRELIEFIMQLRELSGGLPVGIKLCVGDPRDVAKLVRTMVEMGNGPDFITVDGAEGGTGAAPPEYSNSVGLPLEEGLVVVRNLLTGAGMRSKVRINASGKVCSGFSLTRTLALGADITCAARAFMLSLGCIQALKCNTNKCPTGIATQNKELQYGLDPRDKTNRVYNFHKRTVQAAAEIVGTIGHDRFSELQADVIMRRVSDREVKTLADHLPNVDPECLLLGNGPKNLQELWDDTAKSAGPQGRLHWIY